MSAENHTNTDVAKRLVELGQRGILIHAADEGLIPELRCQMETCLCPHGEEYFEERPAPVSDWAPSVDHITEKSAGGKLTLDNVRLAHVLCNRIAYAKNHGLDTARDLERAGTTEAPRRSPAQVMRSFLDAFNRHDVDAIMDFFVDDCEFDTPRGPAPCGRQLRGKAEVREGIKARFDGIPDVHYDDESHWWSGDRGVSEWTISGTTKTGQRIQVRGCDLFQFAGDKIKRKDSFWKIVE